MANELQGTFVSGRTTWWEAFNAAGAVWNGAAYVALSTNPSAASRAITSTEQNLANGEGVYFGNAPAAGVHHAYLRNQAGGAPALTDQRVTRWDPDPADATTISGTVTAGSSTTVVVASSAPAGGANLVGSLLRLTSGLAKGQHGRILGVVGASVTITPALTAAPASGDSFIILPASVDWLGGSVTIQATVNSAGPGAQTDTITITNTSTGLPLADADVWITSDPAGTNTVWSGQTDTQGHVTPLLTAGTTYYLFAQKDGVNDIKGQLFVASAG